MKILLGLVALVGIAVGATYVQYQSLDPCDWLIHDMNAKSDLPNLVDEARMRADFLLDGITDPNAEDCLLKWWKLRQDDPPKS